MVLFVLVRAMAGEKRPGVTLASVNTCAPRKPKSPGFFTILATLLVVSVGSTEMAAKPPPLSPKARNPAVAPEKSTQLPAAQVPVLPDAAAAPVDATTWFVSVLASAAVPVVGAAANCEALVWMKVVICVSACSVCVVLLRPLLDALSSVSACDFRLPAMTVANASGFTLGMTTPGWVAAALMRLVSSVSLTVVPATSGPPALFIAAVATEATTFL